MDVDIRPTGATATTQHADPQHAHGAQSALLRAARSAHDLQGFLAGIRLLAQSLRATGSSSEELETLHQAAQHACMLCGDLQRELREDQRLATAESEWIDLNAMVISLKCMLALMVRSHASLSFHPHARPLYTLVNATQLYQVVIDLVTNASEAVGDRGGKIEVRVEPVQRRDLLREATFVTIGELNRDEYASVSVTDNGCGIANQDIQRIFDGRYTTKAAGQGLGLGNVQRIVRGCGGSLVVNSGLGHGTTIRCLFPRRRGIRPSASLVSTCCMRRAQPESAPPKMNILVVDDIPTMRHVLKSLLERSERIEAQVITARDGNEAIQLLQELRAQLTHALIDWQLPDMDGLQLVDIFHRLAPNIPVLLTSASSMGDMRAACEASCLEHLPVGMIEKPFDTRELLNTLIALHP